LKELDGIEIDVARGLRSLDFFQWHLHFNDVFQQKGGFDVVIGNPPYVRQEQIKELKPALQKEYECYTGTADLFVYFFERGFRLLKPNGNLTYICSNKYMRSGYGEKLRKFLSSEGSIQHLIDFGDAPVFEAIAYPSILQVARTLPNDHQVRSLTWDAEKSVNEFASIFRSSSFLFSQKDLTSDDWQLKSPSILNLMNKLKSAGTPLREHVRGRFYRGVVTGFNDAFVVDGATKDLLIAEHPSSFEVLKPYVRGRDVKRWSVEPQDLWLIFTRRGIVIDEYPAIKKYLEQFKERLTPGVPGGRKAGKYAWYEIQDNIAYWQEFEQPKIVLGIFMNKPTFAFDKQNFFINNALHLIAGADEYVTAILNSSASWWFLRRICTDLQNGYLQAYKEKLEQIPIPNASSVDRETISALVQKCLDAKGQNVAEWEAEINDRVAHLYGLTPEEIKIIEGGQN